MFANFSESRFLMSQTGCHNVSYSNDQNVKPPILRNKMVDFYAEALVMI